MSETVPVVAIDGPAGVGKSSVAMMCAKRLNYHLLISGSLYRVLAMQAIDKHLGVEERDSLLGLIDSIRISFILDGDKPRVCLDGVDVSKLLQEEDCALYASQLAEVPELRDRLLKHQRSFRQLPGVVAEGRDMGTVVFPEAKVKVFLVADFEERVQRRLKQLNAARLNVSLARLRSQLQTRDKRDKERRVSPLRPAGDAKIIDTTKKSIGMVVKEIERLCRS